MNQSENFKKKMERLSLRRFFERSHPSFDAIIIISFILVSAIMCFGMIPDQAGWSVGTVANRTLRADRSIVYEDRQATAEKQQEDLRNFEPVYMLNLDQFNNLTMVAIDRAFDKFSEILLPVKSENTEDKNQTTVEKAREEAEKNTKKTEVRTKLEKTFHFSLSENEWEDLLALDRAQIDLLHKQTVAICSNMMGKGIKENELDKAKKDILDIVDHSYALTNLDKKLVKQILNDISFYPTSVIDQVATDQKKSEILTKTEPIRYNLQKDEIVVSKGEKVTSRQYDAIRALGYTNDNRPWIIAIGVLLAMLVIYVAMYQFMKFKSQFSKCDWRKALSIMLVLMTLVVISFPIITAIQVGTREMILELVGFFIPLPAAAIMAAVLINMEGATFLTMLLALLLGMYTGNIYFSFAGIVGSLAGITQIRVMRRRTDLTTAGLMAGACMALVAVAYTLTHEVELKALVVAIGYAFGNGLLCIMLTLGILPYLERYFDVVTSMSLIELCDPNTPVLRDLMQKAPGTYQHSLMVANLAEAAALRVGADAQLVRTAAFYHDIGKTKRPEFFSENQMTEENPHDRIAPTLSTLIITAHVKDGVAMAKEMHLPTPIIDLISQHHGNSFVSFFYHKAKNMGMEVQESDFRYNAKPPQTREAAILMMADTVEAAVRSNINRLHRGQISGYIHHLIQDKFDDGQFAECNLTFKDIEEITDELTRRINSIYHKRITYPDKKSLSK